MIVAGGLACTAIEDLNEARLCACHNQILVYKVEPGTQSGRSCQEYPEQLPCCCLPHADTAIQSS